MHQVIALFVLVFCRSVARSLCSSVLSYRQHTMMSNKLLPIIAIIVLIDVCSSINQEEAVNRFFSQGNHTDIWAVLVDAHTDTQAGATSLLTIYQSLKKFGVADDHIIVMMSTMQQCSPANPTPGKIFGQIYDIFDVSEGVEIDYRGSDVTILNFLRVLTDRHPPGTLRSKRLLSNSRSNILIMILSHGASGYMKFGLEDKFSADQLDYAIHEMYLQNRYNEILILAITCQAGAVCERLYRAENVLCFGSSNTKEPTYADNGYAYHGPTKVSVFYQEFVKYLTQLLDDITKNKSHSIEDFVSTCNDGKCGKSMYARRDFYSRNPENVSLANFFKPEPQIEFLSDDILDSDFD